MQSATRCAAAALGTLFACWAASACTYDFDGLVAQTGRGGSAGAAGIGGASGAGGTGAGGTADSGDRDGTGSGGAAGAGSGGMSGAGSGGSSGASGSSGKGGTSGTSIDAGKDGAAGPTDAAADRSTDVRDAAPFDCAAVSGTVFQGHCYYPGLSMTNWDNAKASACAPPSHLAVIRSNAEQNAVAAILPGTDRWIGLRRPTGSPNAEASFQWVTGESLSFRLWEVYETGAPEPNYTGDCVRMRATNSWGDINCNDSYRSVCERE